MKSSSRVILHIVIMFGCLVMVYPLVWMLVSSFKPNEDIFSHPSLIPDMVTLANYKMGWQGLSGYSFGKFFGNTFIVVIVSIVGTLVSCSMAAYAFARLEFAWKKLFFALMLVTLMLPFHVTIIPQYIMFNHFHWVNTYLPILVPKFFAVDGFFVFLIVQFIRSLPRELDQAAKIDGCGPIRIYWNLIVPLMLPALVTSAIFTFIWTWNDFYSQLLYISNVRLYTVALALRSFSDSTGAGAWGQLFAMSILSLIPVFAMFVIFQRYLIEGIAAGGLKG